MQKAAAAMAMRGEAERARKGWRNFATQFSLGGWFPANKSTDRKNCPRGSARELLQARTISHVVGFACDAVHWRPNKFVTAPISAHRSARRSIGWKDFLVRANEL
jgi:hypothetical protein